MHKLLSANDLSRRYAISGLIGLLDQCLFLPSTIFYLRPHYDMNENQNQDSSFGSGEVHDLDPVHNLVDGLLGGSGPLSVETVDDLLWPLGSDSGLQTFPYEGFDDSFTYLRSLLDGDSSILPPLGQQPLAPQLPVIGWELLPTGPTQMLVCSFIFLLLPRL